MTDEILKRITKIYNKNFDKIEPINSITYDDLNDREKDEYNLIWASIMERFEKYPNCRKYTISTCEAYSVSDISAIIPFMSLNLIKLLEKDGFLIDKDYVENSGYKNRFTITRCAIINYAKDNIQKQKKREI